MLLNGVPGKPFKCMRGDRQGDPLSPFHFVMAADLLESMINKANVDGHWLHPLGQAFGGDYPIVQYVDDTLILMPAETEKLLHLQIIRQAFASSTGLKIK